MAAQDDLFAFAGIRPDGVIQDVRIDYNTELGRGSDATVYGGTWRAPQVNVAVKELHPLLTEAQAGGREVFLRKYGDECNRLQNLRHDNVVKFLGVTRSRDGTPALVTERMDTTLRHCSQTTELSFLDQLDILCDASAGLAYLHSRGVVHRDLTTRNILLTAPPNRRAKLADVGLSRSLHGNWWFLNYGAALTRCPGTMSYMAPEALTERPAYDERLDSFSFGVLMMAVVLRRDPSTASLHSARERIQDGRSEVIPEVERRASDVNAIRADHPLLDLIKLCLNNDPKRRPSARTIHENLHAIRTRLFPNAQRKPETDHCLDCQRSNQEVVRLNNEVASIQSRLEHQIQTSLQYSAEKDSTIQGLQTQLAETEEVLTKTRDREQDAHSHAQNLEEQILGERERAAREREVLTAQLQQTSSEMEEKMKSALFLDRVRRYNHDLANRSWLKMRVESPFGEWKTVNTNLPDVTSEICCAVHSDVLYVGFLTKSCSYGMYRSTDKTHWERIAVPPNMYSSHGWLSYNDHLFSLFRPDKTSDPQEHLVLFELITEENNEKAKHWKQLPNGRCPILQHHPAVFALDDKLVLAGGRDNTGALSVVTEYCLQTSQWITPSSWPCLPKAVEGMHAVCLGHRLCLFGGVGEVNKTKTYNNMVFSVEVENGKPLGEFGSSGVCLTPYPVCSACRVFRNSLVAGGYDHGPKDGVFVYDSASKAWLRMPSLKVGRFYSSLVMFKDSIVCIGGNKGKKDTWWNMVEELSVSVEL